MLDLLRDVSGDLTGRGVAHALIGAAALTVHGVSRSTFDLDLLVTDRSVLAPEAWSRRSAAGDGVDLRRGDDDDPLAGVVRLTRPGSRSVDVVVGRSAWQAEVLRRAQPHDLGGLVLDVVSRPDLVLLKLFAGGSQDGWDVEQLLALGDQAALRAAVERELGRLPVEATGLWRRLRRTDR
jgi:hypothetical protein